MLYLRDVLQEPNIIQIPYRFHRQSWSTADLVDHTDQRSIRPTIPRSSNGSMISRSWSLSTARESTSATAVFVRTRGGLMYWRSRRCFCFCNVRTAAMCSFCFRVIGFEKQWTEQKINLSQDHQGRGNHKLVPSFFCNVSFHYSIRTKLSSGCY